MKTALIATSPMSVVEVFNGVPARLDIPGLGQVYGTKIGWQSGDGAYKLVAVVPFTAPDGQVATGAPSYAVDAAGVVTETYATMTTPAPIIPAIDFRRLFTPAEQQAITQAGMSNVQLRVWLDDAAAAGNVNLADLEVTGGIAQLVAFGLLTQERANAILAGQAAPAP